MIKKQIVFFGIIGCAALATHLLSVMLCVSTFDIPPLSANVLGFLLAFQISYWGHYTWTFKGNESPHKVTMGRFFAVALLGFAVNEGMYAGLLHHTQLPYDIALIIVLFFVSLQTFTLSKLWAFRSQGIRKT